MGWARRDVHGRTGRLSGLLDRACGGGFGTLQFDNRSNRLGDVRNATAGPFVLLGKNGETIAGVHLAGFPIGLAGAVRH